MNQLAVARSPVPLVIIWLSHLPVFLAVGKEGPAMGINASIVF